MTDRVKLTVLKRTAPSDLFETLPVKEQEWMVPCPMYQDNQEMILDENLQMPEGFCQSAWISIYPNVRTIGYGGNLPFFEEEGVAVSCCTDGMRPVIFKIERL